MWNEGNAKGFQCINLVFLLAILSLASCKDHLGSAPVQKTENVQKPLVVPDRVSTVPPENDFENDSSKYSFDRMAKTANFAAFWEKVIGENPLKNADTTKTFDIKNILSEAERFYDYYMHEAKFLEEGNSKIDSSKILIFIRNAENKTAYGWGKDDVGIFWTPPERVHPQPYGVVAHELAHTFQYLLQQDGYWAFSSKPEKSKSKPIFEMTAQYMLWQVYPEWMTFENYHLKSYLKKAHYALFHEINSYHSPYVLEYWSQLHGKEFIGKLWREAKKGEGPIMAYKRINGLDQKAFNDEIFDGYRKFMTWDLDRIRDLAAPYINMHQTHLIAENDGWYRIAPENTPQNYGYNGIELEIPSDDTEVSLQFKGIAGAPEYRSIHTEKAGWRYGFVALTENGKRVYSDIFSKPEAEVGFRVPKNTVNLWLVISGAPTGHWEHITDGDENTDEQWPYKIRLKNTTIK